VIGGPIGTSGGTSGTSEIVGDLGVDEDELPVCSSEGDVCSSEGELSITPTAGCELSGSTRVTLGCCPAGFFLAVSADGSVLAARPGMVKLGDVNGPVVPSGNVDGANRDGRIFTGGEIGPVLGNATPPGFVPVSTVCVPVSAVCVPASAVVVRVPAPSCPVSSATATAPVPLINMPPATTQATAAYRICVRSTMSSLHPETSALARHLGVGSLSHIRTTGNIPSEKTTGADRHRKRS
jgi:hypothetical protein